MALEQKDIRYRGYSTLPDDYQVVDGAITFATNAVYEDGGLKMLSEALPLQLLVAEGAKIYIHHTVNYYHYIIIYEHTWKEETTEKHEVLLYLVDKEIMDNWLGDDESKWVDAIYHNIDKITDEEAPEPSEGNAMTEGVVEFLYRCDGQFVSLVAVANTLVVSTDENMYYFLCKSGDVDEGQTPLTKNCKHPYIYLGNKVPSVEIEFGLDLYTIGKTYTDKVVSKTNGETEEDDLAGYEKIVSISVASGSGESRAQVDMDYSLESGKGYRLYLSSTDHIKRVVFYGRNDSSYHLLYNGAPQTYMGFTTDNSYEGIRLIVEKTNSTAVVNRTFDLEVRQGTLLNDGASYYIPYTEDNLDAVLGCINKFVNNYATEKNRFIFPFFVRYAVRMYDSSVCELSVPILMTPNSGCVPFVSCGPEQNNNDLNLYAFVAELKYRLLSEVANGWKDIIQGVAIYVSQPIYPYRQETSYDEDENLFSYRDYLYSKTRGQATTDQITGTSYGMGLVLNSMGSIVDEDKGYTMTDLIDTARSLYGFCDGENGSSVWRITEVNPKDEDVLTEETTKVSSFYLIKEINLSDMTIDDEFSPIGMEEGTLSSLAARESLTEDVIGYEQFVGSNLYNYNNRLHTFGGELTYRDSTMLSLQSQYLDTPYEGDDGRVFVTYYNFIEAWVYIHTTEGTKVVHTTFDDGECFYGGNVWFFYPNNRAFKVVISYVVHGPYGNQYYIYLPLSEHEFLNGAYFYLRTNYGLLCEDIDTYRLDEAPSEYDESITSMSIYVSEVDNPFVFRNSMAVTVGSGKILALSSAAQAMSQGQFGQYPLYAFTDEGIWALSVATDGTYSTSQPIARDVVTNVDSITQLDSSVLFVTDRGIMEIAGSKVACMSDGIDGETGQFNPLALPYFTDLYMQYVDSDITLSDLEDMLNEWANKRFFDFIKTCRIVYDYTHQRIIVYNSESNIGYNFSLESKEWSLMFTDLRYTVNSYPDALALSKVDDSVYGITSDDEEHWGLVNLSKYKDESEEEEDVSTEMFITRPFKLDAPDIFKTVDSIVQRGFFQQSAQENHIVGTVLYGSPDLFNWFVVGQSATSEITEGSGQFTPGHIIDKMQGSPYKYFRVLVLCKLRRKENIYGCSLLYELKDNNQLR